MEILAFLIAYLLSVFNYYSFLTKAKRRSDRLIVVQRIRGTSATSSQPKTGKGEIDAVDREDEVLKTDGGPKQDQKDQNKDKMVKKSRNIIDYTKEDMECWQKLSSLRNRRTDVRKGHYAVRFDNDHKVQRMIPICPACYNLNPADFTTDVSFSVIICFYLRSNYYLFRLFSHIFHFIFSI